MSGPVRAVVLLSGGMDSATAAAIARADEDVAEVHAVSVDYGQRARAELDAARRVAAALGVASHAVVRVDLAALGGSALTGDEAVPRDRDDAAIATGIPPTYVPARNIVFLSIALGAAEVRDAERIVIGVNAIDYSGYPDCRVEFLEAFEAMAAVGTRRGVAGRPFVLWAPLARASKADIVRTALRLDVPLADTLSCYDPLERAGAWLHCGRCDACRLRARGFREAGATDSAPRA